MWLENREAISWDESWVCCYELALGWRWVTRRIIWKYVFSFSATTFFVSWLPWCNQLSSIKAFSHVISLLQLAHHGLQLLKLWAKINLCFISGVHGVFCLGNEIQRLILEKEGVTAVTVHNHIVYKPLELVCERNLENLEYVS